jgi:hypothetical protein
VTIYYDPDYVFEEEEEYYYWMLLFCNALVL